MSNATVGQIKKRFLRYRKDDYRQCWLRDLMTESRILLGAIRIVVVWGAGASVAKDRGGLDLDQRFWLDQSVNNHH